MKVEPRSDSSVTDDACRTATGKTLSEWFAELDAQDYLKKGRRQANYYLYSEKKLDVWWCTTIAVEFEKHHGVRKKDGLYEGYFICSTKTISAPLAAVYAAWTSPGALGKWFGDGVAADVRDGGSLSTADGDKGTFLRVRPEKDLRFTYEFPGLTAPTQVDAQFTANGADKTSLMVNHTRLQTRAEADGVRAAWAAALDRLKSLCESM